jgi:hypothetical protein
MRFEMNEGVKILDAGARVLLSGTNAEEVKSVLHDYVRRGAKVVSPLTQLGGKWVAACTFPIQSHPADKTDTLYLADLAEPQPVEVSEDGDPCKVENLGFKRIVTGPTKALVQLRVADMGATLIGDIEEVDGTWTAVCDTGGTQNIGFKW